MASWEKDIIEGLKSYEAPNAAAGPTALDVTKTVSLVTAGTDDTQDTYTLADAQIGQRKIVYLVSGTDTIKVTPSNFGDNSYFELFNPGDYVVLDFDGVDWIVVYVGRDAEVT